MKKYNGLFFARNRRAMQGLTNLPYYIIGKHAMSAGEAATDGGATAFLEGRLRNRRELQLTLKQEGLITSDQATDSELALAAYRKWSDEYPEHMMGPVVTGAIDRDRDSLVLSCDRMGELPVFYTYKNGAFAYADHPKELLDSGIASRVVNKDGLCELFGLGPARTPGITPFRDVMALEPGTILRVSARGIEKRRYYELTAREHEHSEKRTIEEVRMLVERAMDDVAPLAPASMLSGGLDSTVLTALMAKRSGGPVRTFSVDYEESTKYFTGNNFQIALDRPFIDIAVKVLGTDHSFVELQSGALADGIWDAMRLRGMPGMGDIDSSLMLFAGEIAKDSEYVLSGECGDEVFGGYPWFNREEMILSESFPWSGSIALRECVMKKPVRDELHLSRYVCTRYHESACNLPRLATDSLREARLRQLHGLCFKWFMPNLVERAHRMCGASGLNVLTPFSDERLVEYLYNVPWEMKTIGGAEKGLLRRAFEGLLPDELLWRKKSPYPKTNHPEYSNHMRRMMLGVLTDKSSPILELIDAQMVRELVDSPLKPQDTPWYGQLMAGAQMLAYLIQVNDWMLEYRVELDV